MKNTLKQTLTGCCMLLPVLPGYGGQPSTIEIPNIVVSATRSAQPEVVIPAGVSIISQAEIAASGATSVSDVLRGRGGVRITDLFGDGTNATADLRGFGSAAGSNILVLIDGRRLNNTDIDPPDLSSISLKDVERIEIIQGSAGSLYGDQAVGGVINIITRMPKEFAADITLMSGSYSRAALTANVSDRVGERFAYRVSAETLRSDNYRDNNELEYANLFSRLDYLHSSGSLFFDLQSTDEDSEQPGALLASEVAQDRRQSLIDFANDFDETRTVSARFGAKQKISKHWEFAGELTARDADTDFVINFRGCADPTSFTFPCRTRADADREQREQNSVNPRFLGIYPTENGDILLTIGIDYTDSRYDIESLFIDRTNDQEIRSVYLQAVVPVSQRFSYTVAARQAEVENILTDVSAFPNGQPIDDDLSVAGLGFAYEPSAAWRLFARYDQNFRFAKVDEQAFTEVGVIGLRTQQGDSTEIGAEWQSAYRHSAKLLVYRLELEDEIAFDPTANGPFGPFGGANVNFDATLREGVILEGLYQLSDRLSLSGSAAFTDAEFESGVFDGSTVSGVADSVFTAALDVRFNQSLHAYLEIQDIGEQFLPGDNANLLDKDDGYTLANINVDFTYENWMFSARVNNLADRQYVEVANAFGAVNPSPERNIWVKANYQFD